MSQTKSAALSVLFVSFIWGVEFVLIHNAIASLEPHSFNILRFGFGSACIVPFLFFRKKRPRFNRLMLKHGVALGCLLFLGFAFQTFGLLYTTVSNCGFITSLNVVLVPVVAFILMGERPHVLTTIGVSVAAAGLYFLTSVGGSPFNYGDFLTLICALMFALHIVYTGKYARWHAPISLTLIQLLTVTFLSTASALYFEDWTRVLDPAIIGTPTVLFAIFVVSTLGTGAAIMIQTRAQKLLNSTQVALIFALEPVFATLTAYLILSEKLPAASWCGAAMILLGVILSEAPPVADKDEYQPEGA